MDKNTMVVLVVGIITVGIVTLLALMSLTQTPSVFKPQVNATTISVIKPPVNATTIEKTKPVIKEGLFSYWPLDNDTFDYMSENAARVFNALPTVGKSGGAYLFNGKDAYLNLGTFLNFTMWDHYSVSVWFKTNKSMPCTCDANCGSCKIVDKTMPYHDWDIEIINATGDINFWVYEGDEGCSVMSSGYDYRDNKWHHVVAIRDKNKGYLWIDGKLKTTAECIGTVNNTADLILGYSKSYDPNWRRHFGGSIDELMIFNRSLTAEEIQRLYDNP